MNTEFIVDLILKESKKTNTIYIPHTVPPDKIKDVISEVEKNRNVVFFEHYYNGFIIVLN